MHRVHGIKLPLDQLRCCWLSVNTSITDDKPACLGSKSLRALLEVLLVILPLSHVEPLEPYLGLSSGL
jgi:hypothetical protein